MLRSRSRPGSEPLESRQLFSHTFYVAPTGDDASRQPSNIRFPLRTISAAAALAGPGDTVVVRAGTYHETVVPARSGRPGAPVTFEPFRNEIVVADGADPVQNLTPTGGLFATMLPAPVAAPDKNHALAAPQFFDDGAMLPDARWPGPGVDVFGTGGFATAAAGTADDTIVDPTLAAGWIGGYVHFAGGPGYVWQTERVTASVAGRITFAFVGTVPTPVFAPVVGTKYYLTDAPPALAAIQPGESYLDPVTNLLTIDPPAGTVPVDLESKSRNYAFDLSGRSYVRVTGFHLFSSTVVTDAASTHDVLTDLDARYVSHYQNFNGTPFANHMRTAGILLLGRFDTVQNSTVDYSAGNGIVLLGDHNRATGDTVLDTDYSGTDSAGILIVGNDQTAVHDTITTTGRDGILGRSNTAFEFYRNRIAYNDISDFGRITHDLGGVYIGAVPAYGTSIDHNWVHDTASVSVAVSPATTLVGGAGIYLDQGAADITVDHNVVWGTQEAGILLNPNLTPRVDPAGRLLEPADANEHDRVTFNTVVPVGPVGGAGGSINVFDDTAAGTVLNGNLVTTAVFYADHPHAGLRETDDEGAGLLTGPFAGPVAAHLVSPHATAGAYRPGVKPWRAGASAR